MKGIFGKIIAVLTPAERQKLWLLILLDTVISVADILFLVLLLLLVQFYTGTSPAGRWRTFFPLWLDRHSLWPIILFFLLYGVKNLAGFLVYRAECQYQFGVATRISRSKLLHYLEGPWSGYIADSSRQIREISYLPMEFSQHVLGSMLQIITQLLLILLAVAAIIAFNGKLFLLVLLILLPPVLGVFYLIRRRARLAGASVRKSSEKALRYLREAITGYVESNIYGKNEVFLESYIKRQGKYNQFLANHVVLQGLSSRVIEVFALLGIVVLVAVNQWTGGADHQMIITIGVFMTAAYKIIPGVVKILNLSGQIHTYGFAIDNLVLGEKESASVAAAAENGPVAAGANLCSIVFDKVSFSYGGRVILRDQEMVINAGDLVGISGVSGKGKTTIVHLLLGFLAPESGRIIINGEDTDQAARQGYWSRIAYVKQQPFLLSDTVGKNITLSDEDIDEHRLMEIIKATGLDTLGITPEKQSAKMITENGKNISGGQRQRIAFARALYKNADLFILDEPFSELDEQSERKMLDICLQLTREGKAVVLITHNRSNLLFCHKTLLLDER